MSQEPTPVDIKAVTEAVKGGQSLAEHFGLSPATGRALYTAAAGHYEAGRYAEAVDCLIKVTALDARMPDAWALLGNSLMRDGKFAEALEAWSLELHLRPSFASAHLVTRTSLALKDPASAAIGLIAMLKHMKTAEHGDAFVELGRAFQQLTSGGGSPAPGA
jgi:tetratricopeptide (TPR) repeat protein